MHKAILDLILKLVRAGHPLDDVAPALAELCAMAPKLGRRGRARATKVLTLITEAIASAP
jgi:hypothetical protein